MMKRENRRSREKKTGKLLWLIPCILVVAVLAGFGGYMLLKEEPEEPKQQEQKADPAAVEKMYQETKAAAVEEAEDPVRNRIDFEELQRRNPDVYAWINVPGTNIDYPILRSEEQEDEYYLNRTMDGMYGLPGSIYSEKYNAEDFSDNVTIVYGHTLPEDGTMFTELKKYRDRAFFDANPYIYIYLPDVTLKYQIFAAVVFDNRYILGSYDFSKLEDVNAYVSELKNCFEGNINEELPIETKILTLSTCVTGVPSQRWLVSAVQVP